MNHYIAIRNHIQKIKYEIDMLRTIAKGSPYLAIKEMMYEVGMKCFSE